MNIEFERMFYAAIGGLIGGLVGGLLALASQWFSHSLTMRRQKSESSSQLRNFLKAIHAEIETTWGQYNARMGGEVEKLVDGQPLLFYWRVIENYFPVYGANASMVGKIEDDELRKLIVVTYSRALGLIESFQFNGHILQKFEDACSQWMTTQADLDKRKMDGCHRALVDYGKRLKEGHGELKVLALDLLDRLKNIK